MIWEIDELVLFAVGIVSLLIAIECGFTIGSKYADREDAAFAAHVLTLQNSLLGLLALLLGFTFAMSIERYDTRKQLVLEEANAIGTTYLRAEFLSGDHAKKIRDNLVQYVAARLDFYYAGNDKALIEAANSRSAAIEDALWNIGVAGVKEAHNPIAAGLFIQSLNDVIDINEKRLKALENHVPEAVIALLYLVSVVGMGFIGYNYGLTGKRRHGSTALFALLIVSVLIVILDMDRPRRGLIQISQSSMERLQTKITGDTAPD
jgi:hypothetical protein